MSPSLLVVYANVNKMSHIEKLNANTCDETFKNNYMPTTKYSNNNTNSIHTSNRLHAFLAVILMSDLNKSCPFN